MGTTAQKLEYLGTTKSQLKDMINYGLDDNNKITSSTTFRNYVSSIFNAFLEALRTPDTLFTNLPKKSGTGANITLNDTANAPMRIELGASELTQAGTPTPSSPQDIHTISGSNTIKVEGKNIFDIKSFITSRGGTYTENADGSLTLNTNYSALYTQPYEFSDTDINVSLSGIIDDGTATNIRIQLLNSNNVIIGEITSSSSSLLNKNVCKLRFNWSTAGTFTLKNIMLNKGTTALPYTPYVSQEADIDLPVENYLPTSMAKMIANNSTGTWVGNEYSVNNLKIKVNDDLSVVVNGTASAQTTFLFSNNEPLKAGTYVLNGIDGGDIARMYMWDSSWGNITNTTNSVEFTISEDKSIKVGVNLFNGKTFNNFKVEPMVSKNGGTYTPYGTTPLEYSKIGNHEDKFIRNSGKNKLSKDLFDTSIWNVSGTDSEFTIQAKSSGTVSQNIPFNFSNCSFTGTIIYENMNGSVVLREDTTSRATILAVFDSTSGSAVKDLQVSNPVDNLRIVVYSTSSKITFKNCQLESGTTPTDYEPYGSNEWYIKKNIGKMQFNDLTINTYNSGTYGLYFYTRPTDIVNNAPMFYTRLYPKVILSPSTWIDGTMVIDGPNVQIRDSRYSTKEEFKAGVGDEYIWYPLNTPTYTKITGTLAEQLEYIREKMLSQNGQTNISQINNDLAFNMSISALEDIG